MKWVVYIGLKQSDLHALSAFEVLSAQCPNELHSLRRFRTLTFEAQASRAQCEAAVGSCFEWVNPNRSVFSLQDGPWVTQPGRYVAVQVAPKTPSVLSPPVRFKQLLPDVGPVVESVTWVFQVADHVEDEQVMSQMVLSTRRGTGLVCNPVFETATLIGLT
ncbi:hypothetical protein EBZ35_01660 [bacterium]|nr:hypothetical protein [bacterium]